MAPTLPSVREERQFFLGIVTKVSALLVPRTHGRRRGGKPRLPQMPSQHKGCDDGPDVKHRASSSDGCANDSGGWRRGDGAG